MRMRCVLLLTGALLLAPFVATAQTFSVVWDPPAISPVPPQGFNIYRNHLKILSVPATATSAPLPQPYLPSDLIEVSAFRTDANGQVFESALVSAVAPSQPPPTACPAGQFLATYYTNMTLSGTPFTTRCETSINYDWLDGPPLPGMSSDTFSVRWSGSVDFTAGGLTITAVTDDGMRVYFDGTLVIDHWADQAPATYTATRTVTAGMHTLAVEYYENGGGAVAKVSWMVAGAPPPPPPPPPPTDVCAATPLRFSVTRWPSGTTGTRRFDYSSDRAVQIQLELRTTPWKAVATDTRGCTVTVTR